LRNLASSNVTLLIFSERVAQYSASPSSDNPARSLEKSNPKAQQYELVRSVTKALATNAPVGASSPWWKK
jgi:hypothetical protein